MKINKNDDDVIIETKKYDVKNYIMVFMIIAGILLVICLGYAITSSSSKSNLTSDVEENNYDSEITNNINTSSNSEETSEQNTVQTEFTPTEYKEYALNKVEELYDKDCFKYAGYYQHYSSNEIRLKFLFKETMSEDEYKAKIKENTEKIYNELKDRYIKKEKWGDSKDIEIFFTYYVRNDRYVTDKKCIWSHTFCYNDFLDKGVWPDQASDYTLDLE